MQGSLTYWVVQCVHVCAHAAHFEKMTTTPLSLSGPHTCLVVAFVVWV